MTNSGRSAHPTPFPVECKNSTMECASWSAERDWSWLLLAVKRLRSHARPVREKLPRLQPAEVVEKLGFDLMRRADNERDQSPFKRSLMFRDGLAIAFLIRRPLRLRNFAGIKIGTHLLGQDLANIVFPASEMKSKRPFEAAVPYNLRPLLHQYIEINRSYLLSLAPAKAEADLRYHVTGHGTRSGFLERVEPSTRVRSASPSQEEPELLLAGI